MRGVPAIKTAISEHFNQKICGVQAVVLFFSNSCCSFRLPTVAGNVTNNKSNSKANYSCLFQSPGTGVAGFIHAPERSDLTAKVRAFDLCFKSFLFHIIFLGWLVYSDVRSQQGSCVLPSKSMSYMNIFDTLSSLFLKYKQLC